MNNTELPEILDLIEAQPLMCEDKRIPKDKETLSYLRGCVFRRKEMRRVQCSSEKAK